MNRNSRPQTTDGRGLYRWLLARLVTLTWAYGTVLGSWLVMRFVLGDFSWWSFALNSLLLYAFAPLPAVLVVAVLSRRRQVWAILIMSAAVWAWQWGGLFLPGAPIVQAGGPALSVMAYNVLGSNVETEAVLATIRQANADVVALQELNLENAAVIARELQAEYPHQVLNPARGVTGAGVISRFPFRLTGESLPDRAWVSEPHILELEVAGRSVTLVRFHAIANPGNYAPRERQARQLAEYARAHTGPLIVVGDLNVTDQNSAYDLLARELRDAWREVGWGFGHTFPGADQLVSPGSSRPVLGGVSVPQWLVRIDYVFHSDELAALDARLGQFDGMSDHRPVIATLALR